jgi:hypothetical protein
MLYSLQQKEEKERKERETLVSKVWWNPEKSSMNYLITHPSLNYIPEENILS